MFSPLLLNPAQGPQHQHAAHGHKTGQDIVQHDAPACGQPVFRGVHGPGLPDIEQAEQGKGPDQTGPRPLARAQGQQGDPDAHELVDDHFSGVGAPQQDLGTGGGQTAGHDDHGQKKQTAPERQGQKKQRRQQGGQSRTGRARSLGRKPGDAQTAIGQDAGIPE